MSQKRRPAEPQDDGHPYRKVPRHDGLQTEAGGDRPLPYDGPFEDDSDSDPDPDEEVEGIDDGQGMDVDDSATATLGERDEDGDGNEGEQANSGRPFVLGIDTVPEGDALEADESAYVMRHSLKIGWSCLSFDVLRDDLGDGRQRLPATAYVVAGSQADRPENNTVSVFKLSALRRTQVHEDSDEDSEDDEDDDALDEDPMVEQQSIPHLGTVNRVRAQRLSTPALPAATQPYYAAVWSELGKVNIYNIRPLIEALDVPGYTHTLDKRTCRAPCYTVHSHSTEGYAMDWNAPAASSLSLLTGDNAGRILLTTSGNAAFRTHAAPFQSHTASVEDVQWSPTEITVFASCSADASIRVWDIRARARRSVAHIDGAHDSDVNVISWNRSASYLLVSGDDEGQVKVWDLRNIREAPQAPVARFDWHKGPITSIEWHPLDDSVFAASGDDHQVTLWDLAVEPDEDTESKATTTTSNDPQNVPPQLLFAHYQENAKELHWHPQIPGMIISTGIDSLNVFKTISA